MFPPILDFGFVCCQVMCLLNPKLEIKYHNGIVTKILDSDKCLIDGMYHYQPKTEKEIRNFSYLELKSPVRMSLYRTKNSEDEWQVASCFLVKDYRLHQATRYYLGTQFIILKFSTLREIGKNIINLRLKFIWPSRSRFAIFFFNLFIFWLYKRWCDYNLSDL